ncbi:MAG: alpha-L-fucosidase, partial [Candidatus Pacebacteria bacterium]|nr:alpha-L-fucosidase [Candidatus Paceibacterota bacterium]
PVSCSCSIVVSEEIKEMMQNPVTNSDHWPRAEYVGPESVEARQTLQWYRDAKFGMFIHWGLYSINGWGEWHRFHGKIPDSEYHALVKRFNPERFDAKKWVQVAKDAGCQWITITAKHHDGFALFDSDYGDFDIGDSPFRREPLRELSEACRESGLRIGFYYSHCQDWDHPGAGRIDFSREDMEANGWQDYLAHKAYPQVRELVTKLGDVAIVWFDTAQRVNPNECREFRRIVLENSPGTIMCTRLGQGFGDFTSLGDNTIPPKGLVVPWETCMTTGPGWSYRCPPYEVRPLKEVLGNMARIVSRGGNYLLNIGPRPDGTIPEPEKDLFRAIGQWLRVNGEAIYGTKASPFPEQDEVVCTMKGRRLFFHVLDWPEDGLYSVRNLKNAVNKVYLLCASGKQGLAFRQQDDLLSIELPARAPDKHNTVIVAELEGDWACADIQSQQASSGIITIDADAMWAPHGYAQRKTEEGWVLQRTSHAHLFARVAIPEAAVYKVIVEQAAEDFDKEPYWLRINNQRLEARTVVTGSKSRHAAVTMGIVEFGEAGYYDLQITPSIYQLMPEEDMVWISTILLVPVRILGPALSG